MYVPKNKNGHCCERKKNNKNKKENFANFGFPSADYVINLLRYVFFKKNEKQKLSERKKENQEFVFCSRFIW